MYAGSEVWNGVAPVERVETLVHEFFHIYQNVMTEENDSAVPLWFTEGTAEAAGFLAASLGLSRMFRDDLAQLEAGMLLYDAFYRWCRDATEETHNWPSVPAGAGGRP